MLSRAQIKYIQSLRHKKYRQKFGQFVAEGDKIASELIEDGELHITAVYALKPWLSDHAFLLAGKLSNSVQQINERELSQLSSMTTPQQVVVVANIPDMSASPSLKGQLSLVLDNIQDPGNMGTLVRTADWFGITRILSSGDCADPYGPKAVQASMGSTGRVKISVVQPEQVLREHPGIPSYAAVLDGTDINGFGPAPEGLIFLGNESRGLSPGLIQACTHRITIPRLGKAESLNVAVAAGIICSRLSGKRAT